MPQFVQPSCNGWMYALFLDWVLMNKANLTFLYDSFCGQKLGESRSGTVVS